MPLGSNLSGRNISAPVLRLWHSRLTRSCISPFRSYCPTCNTGQLMVHRDHAALEQLRRADRCTLCGQQVWYLDELGPNGETFTEPAEAQPPLAGRMNVSWEQPTSETEEELRTRLGLRAECCEASYCVQAALGERPFLLLFFEHGDGTPGGHVAFVSTLKPADVVKSFERLSVAWSRKAPDVRFVARCAAGAAFSQVERKAILAAVDPPPGGGFALLVGCGEGTVESIGCGKWPPLGVA